MGLKEKLMGWQRIQEGEVNKDILASAKKMLSGRNILSKGQTKIPKKVIYIKGNTFKYKIIDHEIRSDDNGRSMAVWSSPREYYRKRINSEKKIIKCGFGLETTSGTYSGRILVSSKEFNLQTWHGEIFEGSSNELPAFFKGRKVKTWVRLNDDDWEKFGAIFYKNKKR